MATYIPKETALKVVEKYGTTNGFELGSSFALGRHTGLAICIASEIAEIPAADVTLVTRCKDCKHRFSDSWCEYVDDDDNFYCARGKRKDGVV